MSAAGPNSHSSPFMRDNLDVAGYLTVKLSWKGKYKRVFCLGTDGITTLNPQTFQITNQWPYKDVVNVSPKRGDKDEFSLTVLKPGKKPDTLKFTCDHRAELLNTALRYRLKFADQKQFASKQFQAEKHHWSEARVPVLLHVTACAIDQVDVHSGKILCSYDYQETEGFALVSDANGAVPAFAIYYGGFQRMHVFSCPARAELVDFARKQAEQHVGVAIKCKEGILYSNFLTFRLGKFSDDDAITSLVEFKVSKISSRAMQPTRRILCLSESALIERDPATYSVINLKPLGDIYAIVRDEGNPQLFTLEYVRCGMRQYLSTERDSLLATLLDGVRSCGNGDVQVKMRPVDRGKRAAPLYVHVEEEIETACLKQLTAPGQDEKAHLEAVRRFNANVSYSGMLILTQSDSKEKLIQQALVALLDRDPEDQTPNCELHAQFAAIRRLFATKAGFNCFGNTTGVKEKLGKKVVRALKRADSNVTHSAVEMLCALMQPMHDNYDLKQEQVNKASILASDKFVDSLLDLLTTHLSRGSGALVIAALLDFLTFALCAPYSETTDGATFDKLLEKVSTMGRTIFRLFQHPSMSITKSAGMIMRALIEEGTPENAKTMQNLALAEGAFPKHMIAALFTATNEKKSIANRQLSRYLLALWYSENYEAYELMRRIFPAGMLAFLELEDKPPSNESGLAMVRPDNLKVAQEQSATRTTKVLSMNINTQEIEKQLSHWRGKIGLQPSQRVEEMAKPIVLRRRRQRVKATENWALFYYNFNIDHQKSNLIWNHKTREEVRETLESEMRTFQTDLELAGADEAAISWNHREFAVRYACLAEEIKIGDYFLRVLLEENEQDIYFQRPYDFFNDLYHKFLTSQRTDMRCMCLSAMTIVYRKCANVIGTFNDTRFIILNLEKTNERQERDRLVQFIDALTHHEKNVKLLIDCNGVKTLVELMTLAHLHTTRATVPLQSNLIEASPEMQTGSSEKEWYYTLGGAAGDSGNQKQGPVSFEELKQLHADNKLDVNKSKFWAAGMDGWKGMRHIPQLKWSMLAVDNPVMNETDLAVCVLNILLNICAIYKSRDENGSIIRPLPRIRRILSDPLNLPHIVQLLLTFDPTIVEKTTLLIHAIMMDNPGLSRLYLTGMFFFILMYTGSNVLPIAQLLEYAHMKQAFRSDTEATSDVMRRSVLGPLLPDAMVYFLVNHGPERFAAVFLGESNTPEAIWSNDMRQHLILKIAYHLSDFTPRLRSNNRAVYQYCALPVLGYPQLEGELFVNIYYLRNFCNQDKFNNWPVSDPVGLLRECLEEWKREVEKKGSGFTESDALAKLGLKSGEGVNYTESEIRRAYFKLAQKYHPDKNPEGRGDFREMFEEVNVAYEYLCSRKAHLVVDGPNPANINLLLRTQSILFNNYSADLEPYKYAGYPMLIKTMRIETEDEALFSKQQPLLPAATELAYHTVRCSALNAEELRRDTGLQVLQEALARCVPQIGKGSKPEDMAVQVCGNVVKCFSVAAQFEGSRAKMLEMGSVVKDICRLLFYKHLPGLCVDACQCVSVLALDGQLQDLLLQCGVVWHLLLALFQYDYTKDESGIAQDHEHVTSESETTNKYAKQAVGALTRLAGCYSPSQAGGQAGGGSDGSQENLDSLANLGPYPENRTIQACLNALLSPYLYKIMVSRPDSEFLKLLNTNTENPYLIWDNGTRTELLEYVKKNQQDIIRSGECDQSFGSDFQFTVHAEELVVGDVYVRIYNEQPTFALENPKLFARALMGYIGSEAEYITSLQTMTANGGHTPAKSDSQTTRLKHMLQALDAIKNCMKNNQGVETECIGHFKLIFSLLHCQAASSLQFSALEMICAVVSSKECVASIAEAQVLGFLLVAFETMPSAVDDIILCLHNMVSNRDIVKECKRKGAFIYILHVFCSSTDALQRQHAAELMAKLMSTNLHGTEIRIFLSNFLPSLFMEAMRDNAENAVHLFETTQENPELVWKDEVRDRVKTTVRQLRAQLVSEQIEDPDFAFALPRDFTIEGIRSGDLTIEGVILSIFVSQPTWVVRKPVEFMTGLLVYFKETAINGKCSPEELELVVNAIVAFFTVQKPMLARVVETGCIPSIIQALSSNQPGVNIAAVKIVHVLSEDELVVKELSKGKVVEPLLVAMQRREDCLVFACEALYRMFNVGDTFLVKQALDASLVEYMLTLLSKRIEVSNQKSVKAHIVDALKAMSADQHFGPEVAALLDASQVWTEYSRQKHDLFIENTPTAGYLTGGPQVAGYLTQGPPSVNPSAPPNLPPEIPE